jgi:hypothetical protein
MMTPESRVLQLVHEPGRWAIELNFGGTIVVNAHGFTEETNAYVFSLLMEGTPCFEMEVLRIPRPLVKSIEGG